MTGIICAVGAVVTAGIASPVRVRNRRWVNWPLILIKSWASFVVIILLLRRLVGSFRARGRFREFLWLGADVCRIDILKIVELALSDLLADDVDVVGVVHLLEGLRKEPWQKTHDDCQQPDAPERQCTINLGCRAVEGEASGEGGVGASPQEDQQD